MGPRPRHFLLHLFISLTFPMEIPTQSLTRTVIYGISTSFLLHKISKGHPPTTIDDPCNRDGERESSFAEIGRVCTAVNKGRSRLPRSTTATVDWLWLVTIMGYVMAENFGGKFPTEAPRENGSEKSVGILAFPLALFSFVLRSVLVSDRTFLSGYVFAKLIW